MQFNNVSDCMNYLKMMNMMKPQVKLTKQQLIDGMPLPKLFDFLSKTKAPNNWKRLESYMYINGTKLQKSYKEIKNKKIYDGNNMYKLGFILEKQNNKIKFMTYTLCDRKCVLNHMSNHKMNSNLVSAKINLFDHIDDVGDDLIGGCEYVNEMLDEILSDTNKFTWDEIELLDQVSITI